MGMWRSKGISGGSKTVVKAIDRRKFTFSPVFFL